MTVNNYDTTLAPFSIIIDDDLYNWGVRAGSRFTFLASNHVLSSPGIELRDMLSEGNIQANLMVNTESVNLDDVYNDVKAIIPSLALVRVNVDSTESFNYPFQITNSDYSITIRMRYYNNPADLRVANQEWGKGTDVISLGLFGYLTAYNAGSGTAQIVEAAYLLVMKSDLSAGLLFLFRGEHGGNVNLRCLSISAAQLTFITNFMGEVEPFDPEDREDPFSPGGTSGTGGGNGTFSGTSDTIGIPGLPALSATDTGFMTLFSPSLVQLRSLANYLWSDLLSAVQSGGSLEETVNALKKIVSNPYDAIMGLSIVPVAVPTSAPRDVKMYGVLNSGVTMSVASSQYVAVDCGTLDIQEYWGAYLDYSPYTKVTSLYLPYIGVVSIDVDQIMGKRLGVVYHIDILSGQCIAYITINGSVEFQYQGHCSISVPVTASDWSNVVTSGIGLIGNVANIVSGGIGGAAGGPVGAAMGAVASAFSQAPSIASNVMNAKPDIKAGGGVGSMGGMMSVQKPYLIIERPLQSRPAKQNQFTGYPSNINIPIRDCRGYTEYDMILLDNVRLTNSEKEELERILQNGVYIRR